MSAQLVGPNGKPIGTQSNDLWLIEPSDIQLPLKAIRKFKYSVEGTLPSVAALETMSAHLRDAILEGRAPKPQWQKFFLAVGAMTIDVLGTRFKEDEFITLLLGKHKRYGIKSLMGWRELGIHSRIDQKIARAMNMIGNPRLADDDQGESMNDTLADIIGYCVLGLYMVEFTRVIGKA